MVEGSISLIASIDQPFTISVRIELAAWPIMQASPTKPHWIANQSEKSFPLTSRCNMGKSFLIDSLSNVVLGVFMRFRGLYPTFILPLQRGGITDSPVLTKSLRYTGLLADLCSKGARDGSGTFSREPPPRRCAHPTTKGSSGREPSKGTSVWQIDIRQE